MAKANNNSLCPLDLTLLPVDPQCSLGSHRAGQGFCDRGGQKTSVSPLLAGTYPRNVMLLRMETEIKELKTGFYV